MFRLYNQLNTLLFKQVSIAPLVVFRIVFGSLLFFSTIRTLQKGWVTDFYVEPDFHFGFFSWLSPLGAEGMYVVFALLVLSSLGIILGFLYRFNSLLFLLLFTYVELLDKTFYLNHYYLVSLLCFWLTLVPANRHYAIDVRLFPKIKTSHCSNWHILIFKIQLSIVYFFAGLAKVNPDWILKAQPMATWLPGKYQLPILGKILHFKQTAFIFSWAGCAYDLFIWVFLWLKKWRSLAYFFVLLFHVLTAILFPRIGMFPYIMITSTIIFFSASWHQKILNYLPFYKKEIVKDNSFQPARQKIIGLCLIAYFICQLYLPLRYLQYSGNLFWHEKGYRFSWRVMLMEKNGFTAVILNDPHTNTQREVDQHEYLTPFQMQQMKSQPDMLLQFSKYIGDQFVQQNGYAPEIYIKSRLSLNGRRSQPFTNDTVNVYALDDTMQNNFIIPLKD